MVSGDHGQNGETCENTDPCSGAQLNANLSLMLTPTAYPEEA